MSTKNNPGAWRCYEAALPDEPIFTILARDPAGPATLQFWAQERNRVGKTDNPEDCDRIDNALRDAEDMTAWRAANLDPMSDGSGPSWKLVRITDDDGGPVRMLDNVEYVAAERNGSEAVRVSIEWLRSLGQQLVRGDISRDDMVALLESACQSPDRRRREQVVPVEEAAYDAARRDDRAISLLNAINSAVAMLDDLRNIHDAGKRLDPVRATLVNAVLNISIDSAFARQAEADPYQVFADTLKEGEAVTRSVGKSAALGMGYTPDVKAKIAVGLGQVATDLKVFVEGKVREPETHQTAKLLMSFVDRMNGYASELREEGANTIRHLRPDDSLVVDSAPDDLAHGPEVPPHRFSTFHKGKRYAYARGLEINPIHLPTALDAMAEDGWHLLAIFGQTDSKHVGFIFQREQRAVYIPSGLDLAHGFGMPFEKPDREGPEYHRFMAGEPLEDIREDQPCTGAVVTPIDDPCGPEGRGRGLEP